MANQIDPRQLLQQANYAAGAARNALDATTALNKRLDDIQASFKVQQGNRERTPNLMYVENIPGRRVPFDLLVNIPIGNNVNSVQQGTILVSQEGPFVAVSRVATFISQLQLQRQDPTSGAKANFFGRSFGRQRPIHSAWDIMDGMPRQQAEQQQAFPGTGAPHILSPSNGSPFRTMESDYTILFLNAGSSFPRSNIPVPSAFWTRQINSPFELGALDVFERGETLTFRCSRSISTTPVRQHPVVRGGRRRIISVPGLRLGLHRRRQRPSGLGRLRHRSHHAAPRRDPHDRLSRVSHRAAPGRGSLLIQ